MLKDRVLMIEEIDSRWMEAEEKIREWRAIEEKAKEEKKKELLGEWYVIDVDCTRFRISR